MEWQFDAYVEMAEYCELLARKARTKPERDYLLSEAKNFYKAANIILLRMTGEECEAPKSGR